MTNSNVSQSQGGARPRTLTSVPPVGADRRSTFWQRWKEWERDNGTVPAPRRDQAA